MTIPRTLLNLAAGGLLFGTGPSLAGQDEKAVLEQAGQILTGKCLTCHGPDKKKGGLELTRLAQALAGGRGGPALVPGKPSLSLLYQKASAGEMPPGNPLSPEQIAALARWIEAGAAYPAEPLVSSVQRAGPDWWSLRKIARPTPPPVRDVQGLRNPIDAFIRARLEEKGLRPAPGADRATLLRRVTFDLLGLPPTPEEIDAFAADPAPDAYERLIDRLLASPQYGERWGRHWLDVVRFAESHGYETNQLRPNAWPYRDYAIRAFNEDVPYPRFILEQLAGNRVPGGDWLVQAATGFLVGGAHDVVGNQTLEGMLQQRMDDLDDMITTVGATFLGMTVNCCRCHDHKFDPLTQRDYYGLQAVFAGVQHAEREIEPPDAPARRQDIARLQAELSDLECRQDDLEPLAEGKSLRPPVNARRNVERFRPVPARFVRFTVTATNNLEPCIDELEVFTAETPPRNLALAKAGAKATASSVYPNSEIHRLEHLNDGRYGNGRSWISNEPGKGWVQIELPAVATIDRIVWGRDREEKYKDRLAVGYRIEVAVEPGQWHLVASFADRAPYDQAGAAPARELPAELASLLQRRKAIQDRLDRLRASNKVYAGTFKTPEPTHVLLRGDPLRKGEAVPPSAIATIQPPLALDANASDGERRLALARWLAHPDNPLPARVLVNRIWHYHFGQGLVATPSDFGYNGDRPSHPELLDWLASEFIRTGWQIKPLHRLILLSASYRQSSRVNEKALAVDRQNRLLWRMSPRRLEAEAIRDAILAVSGRLDRRMGGPGYELWEKNTNYVVVFQPKAKLGPNEFRRMVYQFKPRSQQDPTFGLFDCPDAALARPRRNVSTTALQALNLFNGSFILAQSASLAERLRREGGDEAGQVDRAFRLAFGRPPAEAERAAAVELIRRHGLPAFSRAMYNANEFLYVD
jgi:mono/diheme cytochrome c family protein